jgi:hypothetical protein
MCQCTVVRKSLTEKVIQIMKLIQLLSLGIDSSVQKPCTFLTSEMNIKIK